MESEKKSVKRVVEMRVQPIMTLAPVRNHVKPVTQIHGSGEFVVTSGDDGLIQLFSASSMERVTSFLHVHPVSGICFDRNQGRLFFLDDNSTLSCLILKENSFTLMSMSMTLPFWAKAVACDDGRVFVGDADGYLRVFSVELKEIGEPRKYRDASIYQILITDEFIVLAYSDKDIIVLEKESMDVHVHLRSVKWTILDKLRLRSGVSITVDTEYLYVAPFTSQILVYDLHDSFRLVKTLKKHRKEVLSLHVNEKYLVSGSADNTIILWEKPDFSISYQSPKHENSVTGVWIIDTRVLTASGGGTLRVIDAEKKERVLKLHEPSKMITSITGGKDFIVVGSEQGEVKFINPVSTQILHVAKAHEGYVLALDSNDRFIVSGGLDGFICVWEFDNANFEFVLQTRKQLHFEAVNQVFIEGKTAYTASSDSILLVVDLPSLEVKGKIKSHSNKIRTVHVDSKFIYSAGSGKEIHVHDKQTLELIIKLKEAKATIRDLNSDSQFLFAVTDDGEFLVYSKEDFSLISSKKLSRIRLRRIAVFNNALIVMGLSPNLFVFDRGFSLSAIISCGVKGIRDYFAGEQELTIGSLDNKIYAWELQMLFPGV